ncbi:GDSL-type esterase/lipase family protein [Gramella sp. AN32]|uniref:GDSL-type esterase/lipase family protein n=1 Tax=Christiangramia antarctica TaxID=2058158 RepID=A0ABW5X1C3_9FLAO|nr:GDSL-type esterase/lipase family protein [Gramella sp. AN32]MCM4155703.1 sialate O-acetylesterase [Gramella sp. AN32]
MKNFIALLMIVSCLSSYAQNSIETTYRPKTYPVQVKQFRTYPDSKNDIIFLGNSITARAQWNELLQLPMARNRGISGDTTFGILERLDEVTEGQPSKIFLLIGINDISRGFPDDLILKNFKEIISRIQKESPETKIYIETILPVNKSFNVYKRHYDKDGHILYINDQLRKIAPKMGITLIDIYPEFLDDQNRLNAEFTDEGLHLNEKGYLKWAKILKPYLE